ncbi:MAG: cysteine desulfurase family protein [Acidimicrobiales bacterium]
MAVYLDHAATNPLRGEALEAMLPWLTVSFGNPSGAHRFARAARQAVDEARESIAADLGCRPGEVVFTSGGTEADNLAILGFAASARSHGSPSGIVCSAIEHHAVLHAVAAAGGQTVGVDGEGRLRADLLASTIGPDTGLVSMMLANNEVGTITDLGAVAAQMQQHAPLAILHTDAVQAAAWLDLTIEAQPASLVSVAAHKFGGPQGVGALVVRRGVRILPQVLGGGQERDLRSGTHNVAGIAGMAAALRASVEDRDAAWSRVAGQRDRLVRAVTGAVEGVLETAPGARRLPNIAHLRISGVENESLLMLLDDLDVCAAAGSSCASGAMEPSHVLAAMGFSRDEARSALRLSLGRATTDTEIEQAASAIASSVTRLRRPVRTSA